MDTLRRLLYEILAFIGKLNWGEPLTYLAILGALGAPGTFVQVWRWLLRFWNTTLLQIRHPAVLKDFYFTTRDFGYRILEDGKTYLNVRRETVVSKVKGLDSIPFNYKWSGSGEITEEIEPASLTIRDRPKIAGKTATRKSVFFEQPLDKRQKCSFTLNVYCVATVRQPEPFVSSASSRRVDKLILRVAFPLSAFPARVAYRVLDVDGSEKYRKTLDCSDYLTGEYRIEIKYPKPFYEHRIEWE